MNMIYATSCHFAQPHTLPFTLPGTCNARGLMRLNAAEVSHENRDVFTRPFLSLFHNTINRDDLN